MYTYRITQENGNPVVWVDKDGHQLIYQPHHPQAYMNAPWSSEEEAIAWAESWILSQG